MMRWRNHRLAISFFYRQILGFYWIVLVIEASVAESERSTSEHPLATPNITYQPKPGDVEVHFRDDTDGHHASTRKNSSGLNQSSFSNLTFDFSSSSTNASTEHGAIDASAARTSTAPNAGSSHEPTLVTSDASNTSRATSTPSTVFITTASYSRTVRISLKSSSNVSNPAHEKSATNDAFAANQSAEADSGVEISLEKPVGVNGSAGDGSYKELATTSAASFREDARRNSSFPAADGVPDRHFVVNKSSHHDGSSVDQQVRSATGKETLPDYPSVMTNRTKMKNGTATEPSARNVSSVPVTTEQVRPRNATGGLVGTPSNIIKAMTSTNALDASKPGDGGEAVASEMYATSNPTMENVQARGDLLGAGAIVGIIFGVIGVVVLVGGVFGYLIYHRRFRPLSEIKYPTDNCGYVDDTLRVSYINNHIELPKENSEEMFSLDNDSFLNSLEAMTLQNYWAEDAKNTKV